MNFRRGSKGESVGFQIAPMIDIVFLLLCFFVTSQLFSQWESEIDISLPTAVSSRNTQRMPGEIILNVFGDGRVVVNGRSLADDELASVLKRLAGLFPGQPVLIRADRKTDYEHIVRVLDVCRRADIWNISFATALSEDQPAGT